MEEAPMVSSDAHMVFLVCSERSGSNLITRIMDAHPEFCGPAPLHLIRTFSRNLYRYGNLRRDEHWEVLTRDVADLIGAQLGAWTTQWDETKIRAGVKHRGLAAIIQFVYGEEARANGKQCLMIKENRVHTFLPFILVSFPQAKFIYLVRDPRDMALSWKLSANHPGGLCQGARMWQEDQEKGIEILGFLGSERIVMTKYEELVFRGEAEVRRLCDFLGIAYYPSMLEYYRNDLTIKNAQRLRNWANLQKPLLRRNFNKYRTGLSAVEIQCIESICAREMEILGYPLEFCQPASDSEELQKAVLEMEKVGPQPEDPPSEEEEEIRRRRLEVIDRILGRQLFRQDYGK